MQCLISGEVGPVLAMMPVPVKGLPGGRSEMAIVSANEGAYESYGLTRAQTSPISRPAGERFGQALNALLASGAHRHTGIRVTYIFWSRSGPGPVFAFAPPPEADDLAALLAALQRSGQGRANGGRASDPRAEEFRAEEFHLFGLTANAARVVVRSALDTTLGEIGARQAAWFTRLALIGPDGLPGGALSLRALAVAAYREFKDVAPALEDALVQAALAGTPLPESLLRALVMRCRLDMDVHVTYPRAALLKYLLTQTSPPEAANALIQEVTTSDVFGEVTTSDVFGAGVLAVRPAAYHCGRLLAELEDVQKAAMPGVDTGVGALFFGAAATAPNVRATPSGRARPHCRA